MAPQLGIGMRSERVALLPGVSALDEGDLVALHTPRRRDFHDGNQLLLPATPARGSVSALLQRWASHYADVGAERVVMSWEASLDEDARDVVGDESAALGLDIHADVVLTADHAPQGAAGEADPPAAAPRPVDLEEWPAVVEAYRTAEPDLPEAFARWQLDRYREVVAEGRGRWWVLEVDGTIAASAGLVVGDGLGRYQQVVTVPAHRRRGHAQRLVTAMLLDHLRHHPGSPAVIVAEEGSSAERIYRRAGLSPVSRLWTLNGPVSVVPRPTDAAGGGCLSRPSTS